MRFQKARRLGGVCVCSSPSHNKAVLAPGGIKYAAAAAAAAAANDDGLNQDASAYLYVFAYVLKKNLRHTLRRQRTVITLRFRSFDSMEDNMREADRWYKTLRLLKLMQSESLLPTEIDAEQRRNRLLILLNPKSGTGNAREMFHQLVAPILNEAELPYDLHITKYANYARDFMRLRDISVWRGVVAIGGDGLFFEILNGLLQRADWSEAMKKIKLGIVPCGSGNGLARSIAHLYK